MTTQDNALAVQAGRDPNAPYKTLVELLRKDGWFQKKAPGRMLLELALHVSLSLGGIVIFVLGNHLILEITGLLVMTTGGLGMATNTHTSSHNATSKSMRFNRFLVFFGSTFFHGVSAMYWWHKHVVVHHPNPNVIGVDDDVDLMPVFALNQREIARSTGLRRVFYRSLQGVLIPFAIALNGFNMQQTGLRFLIERLADPKQRRRLHWIDLGTLALHVLAWIVLPMFFFAPLDVIGFYVLREALMGYAGFIGFAPAHFPDEAAFADKSQEDLRDYLLRQTATTVNFKTGPIGRLLCSGVEYQIEHHLFPGIPHVYYPALSPIVKQYCDEHGYPHRTLGWGEALWKSLRVFYRPKEVVDDLEAFQHVPAPVAERSP